MSPFLFKTRNQQPRYTRLSSTYRDVNAVLIKQQRRVRHHARDGDGRHANWWAEPHLCDVRELWVKDCLVL